jgi:hypothetical protein
LTNCPGTSANFSVNATGTGLSYQWYKGASALAGETTSSLTLNNVSSTDAGTYNVVVSGTCGNAVTNSASLTVNQNVVVATSPVSLTNCPGTSANFSVNATGTGLSYQWYKGTSALAGETTSSLTLNNVSATDGSTYSVVVSGTCGNAVTNSASLTVNQNVVVATAPVSLTNCPGTSANFSVNATGTGLSYQWYKGGSALAGQTSSSLNLANVSSTDAGTYSVVVSGTCGNAVTNSASLTVNQNVVVATAPVSLTNCPGTSASFSVNATGTGLSYQWYKGGSALAGETTSSLTLNNVSATDAGTYSVVVSGTCGNAVTNSASLTVNQNVVVATAPVSLTNCPGTSANFSVNATGTGLSYQWYKGGSALAGQTSSSLNLANISATDAGTYSVVVSGTCGNAVTNSASLTVNQNVVVATAPVSLTNCPGTSASFSVNATGTGLSYQWYKGGSALAGATTSSLTLNNVTAADAGTYSVTVAGTCGTVSRNATLTVNASTTATSLVSTFKNVGDSVTFSTVTSGTGPFSYVWKKNGVVLSGQTGSSLTLVNLAFGDAGTYSVEVTGTCNMAIQSATLTINHPPTVAITSPTNGAVFLAPADFTVLADAQDVDGTISKVEFFTAGNPLAETTNAAPYFVVLTNVQAGTYTFTARATDNLGATGVSAPVTITVLEQLPLTIVAAMHFNPQTGLFEQTVRVSNPTASTLNAVRVYAYDLTNNARLYNASGTNTSGIAYVQSSGPVAPGSYVDFVMEYYVPSRITPYPTLVAQLVQPETHANAIGAGVHIDRGVRLPDGTFLIEFSSISNRVYYIQYSRNLIDWKTAFPAITGNGTHIQWIDNGLPKTESSPATEDMRFYRLIVLP